jgi:MoxR-like ATPase
MTTMTTTALPACWKKLNSALDAGIDRVILYGPSGTGKTYAGISYGDTRGGSFRLTCTEDMTNADVTGSFMPDSKGGWTWLAGSALKAWNGNGIIGGRLVADEIDKASGDVLATMLNMFDSPESASWEHPDTGVIHKPLNGFSVVMTTNVEDMRELPSALSDRFSVRIRINEPHPDALARLSNDLRGIAVRMADAGKQRISLRAFMDFDKLRSALPLDEALDIVFGERAGSIADAMRIDSL